MANIKSAIKRIRVTERKTAVNKRRKSEIKTLTKNFQAAVNANDKDLAQLNFNRLEKQLSRARNRNLLHKNAVSRRISRMQKQLNQL